MAIGQKRKWRYIELKGGAEHLNKEKPSAIFWGHILDLTCGIEKLFCNLRNSTRRNIKKAQSENVEINISNSFTAVKEFYRLNLMTRKDHGIPPQPFCFFQKLYEHVIEQNMGFVATASIANRIIAANIYLHFGNEVIYKYGASNRRYQHLRANNLIMWEAIRYSCKKGFKEMNFGRTELDHKGLMQFKGGWGAKPYQIIYHKYDLRKDTFVESSVGIDPVFKIFSSKLPISFLEILGRILYRHMG